jgi:hypothetical protein
LPRVISIEGLGSSGWVRAITSTPEKLGQNTKTPNGARALERPYFFFEVSNF